MLILGLHFGHDPSISVVRDGKVLICLEIERLRRIKHSLGIKVEEIMLAISDTGISLKDIDYATITTTQTMEYVFFDYEKLSITPENHEGHKNVPCTLKNKLNLSHEEFIRHANGCLKDAYQNNWQHGFKSYLSKKDNDILHSLSVNNDKIFFGGFESFINLPIWDSVLSLKDIASTNYSNILESDDVRHGFHFPFTLNILGYKIPAFVFSHHYAHLCYTFYQSNFDDAAIITNDGYCEDRDVKYESGLFGYGKGNKLFPITPNGLNIGGIYHNISNAIGFDGVGGPGKMMGLSSYGKPNFFDYDFIRNFTKKDKKLTPGSWMKHCIEIGKQMGYDIGAIGDKNRILEPINVDIAASTQKLLEEIMLKSSITLNSAMMNSDIFSTNLCLAGGTALNCPANSKIVNESPFDNIFVPPAVNDTGLSIGSALALYYNILGNERVVPNNKFPQIAYLGLNSSASEDSLKLAIEAKIDDLEVNICTEESIANLAAQDLADNKIIALFYGRSEIGPRALGHRSILANPTKKENWERVNKIKSRELWRPFAPIVLEGMESKYFSHCQFPSYFMLLNAEVRVKNLPAITHVDQSSRVQSVNQECGIVYNLLERFFNKTGVAVLLNTSFNGPGEPVMETPDQAIDFLLSTELDCLYFSNYKLTKKKISKIKIKKASFKRLKKNLKKEYQKVTAKLKNVLTK